MNTLIQGEGGRERRERERQKEREREEKRIGEERYLRVAVAHGFNDEQPCEDVGGGVVVEEVW